MEVLIIGLLSLPLGAASAAAAATFWKRGKAGAAGACAFSAGLSLLQIANALWRVG